MPNEFILQQTSIPEKKYNSGVLIGNWYEEKTEPNSKYSKFHVERKFEEKPYNVSKLTEQKFMNSNQNWLNFQPTSNQHFQTTNYRREFKKPLEQTRTSALKPFIVKKGHFDKNPQELQQYREKWTTAPHIYDRTYFGVQK